MFEIVWKVTSTGYLGKLSANDHTGGGAYTSYGAFIYKDDEEYISTSLGYVVRVNPHNTVLQNRAIESHWLADNSMFKVVEFDREIEDFPIPRKAQFVLDSLNANEKNFV